MKILFLPHCLRNFELCDNKYNQNGLICNNSHDCTINRLKEFAEELKYKVFIAPGGSLIEKLVKKLNPEFVVGVACEKEIKIVKEFLTMPYISIKLIKDGCINTQVDEEKVKEVLNANK
ncbi:MAG: DUF116 domain-containing protein [Nanoarchaeota archaeon]|nr:DUF116 domain-containing protein [Nanoarchaeota archaeon]